MDKNRQMPDCSWWKAFLSDKRRDHNAVCRKRIEERTILNNVMDDRLELGNKRLGRATVQSEEPHAEVEQNIARGTIDSTSNSHGSGGRLFGHGRA